MDRYLILDLDETLITTLRRQYEVVKSFFIINDIKFYVSYEKYLDDKKKNKCSNFDLFLKYNNDETKIKLFKNFYLSNIESLNFLNYDELIVDLNLLKAYKETKNLKMALVSLRNNEINSIKQLELLRLKDLFDSIFFLNHNNLINPKVKILNDLKAKNKIISFIGDSKTDYEAAAESGIHFIKVNTGFFSFDYLGDNYNSINHFFNYNINL